MYRSKFENCYEYIKEIKREHGVEVQALSCKLERRRPLQPTGLPRFRLSDKFMIWPSFHATKYVQYPSNEQLRQRSFADLQPLKIGASLTSIRAKFGILE